IGEQKHRPRVLLPQPQRLADARRPTDAIESALLTRRLPRLDATLDPGEILFYIPQLIRADPPGCPTRCCERCRRDCQSHEMLLRAAKPDCHLQQSMLSPPRGVARESRSVGNVRPPSAP